MTVKELVEQLLTYDQNMDVKVTLRVYNDWVLEGEGELEIREDYAIKSLKSDGNVLKLDISE